MNWHWLTVVWGQEYTAHFLKAVVPNLLSPLNLPNCSTRGSSVFKIYTTFQDAETIRRAPIFRKLSEVLISQIVIIEDVLDALQNKERRQKNHPSGAPGPLAFDATLHERNMDKYGVMNQCHRHAIFEARETPDVAFVFLPPDAIFSDGSFMNMVRIANSGKRAIMIPGLRLAKDTFTPMFLQKYYCDATQTATISSRELARHALEYLHPMMKSCFWDSAEFGDWASLLLWRIPHEGFLARCLHLHPIFVRPLDRGALPSSTIDGAYLVRACPNFEDIYVVEDSDEMLCMETTKLTQTLPENTPAKVALSATPRRVGSFAHKHCDAHHQAYFRHKIRIHCEDISPAWSQIENETDRIEKSVLRWHKFYACISLLPPMEKLFKNGWSQRLIWSLRKKIRLRTRLKNLMQQMKPSAGGAKKV